MVALCVGGAWPSYVRMGGTFRLASVCPSPCVRPLRRDKLGKPDPTRPSLGDLGRDAPQFCTASFCLALALCPLVVPSDGCFVPPSVAVEREQVQSHLCHGVLALWRGALVGARTTLHKRDAPTTPRTDAALYSEGVAQWH